MLLFKSSTFGSWPLFSGSTGSSHACFRKINILYSPQLQTQYILIRRKQHAPAHHRPPQNVWGGESFKINDLTPPRLVGVQYTDFKGKNGNIGGKLHIDPPSPLSASGTGGGVVLWCPPPKTAFYVMKTRLLPPTELCGALWWACGAHWWLNYLVDNLFAAHPHRHFQDLVLVQDHPQRVPEQAIQHGMKSGLNFLLWCGGHASKGAAVKGIVCTYDMVAASFLVIALAATVAHEISHFVQYRYGPDTRWLQRKYRKPHGEGFQDIYRILRSRVVNSHFESLAR